MRRTIRRSRPIAAIAAAATGLLLVVGLPSAADAQPVAHATAHRAAGHTVAEPDAQTKQKKKDGGQVSARVRHLCAGTKADTKAKTPAKTCLAEQVTGIRTHLGVVPNDTPAGYGPADLADAYNVTSTGDANKIVAVTDAYGYPNAEQDLAVYRSQYGLPPCTTANGCFKKINQRGGTDYPPLPSPLDDWTGETALDLDMVSAICPNCHILLVEADDDIGDGLFASINEAVSQGAKFISNSWSTEEFSGETGYDSQYLNHPGVAITASSGDDGYAAGVGYPASAPTVTSVGGTALVRDSSSRGWSESVWNDQYGAPGSGCSAYETKPSFQTDPGCPKRMITDVSADADPVTGVAVYDTANGNTGWGQYGGTSASSPMIAAMYAIAGNPGSSDNPLSYPYAANASTAFNDVTSGNDGSCSGDPAYFCTAQAGYDGPTGLGTPNGVQGFGPPGPRGDIAGKVTDKSTGHAIAGASVTAGTATTATKADGTYDLSVPPGKYTVTASAFGYGSASKPNVTVTDGATTTANFALSTSPRVTLSGSVTDGSGHSWPLYAKVTVTGTPLAATFTTPATGHYQLTVPANATYTLHVESQYPGYVAADVPVTVGATNKVKNVSLVVNATSCTADGYVSHEHGLGPETFDSTSAPPAGWTVQNSTDSVGGWEFDDPGERGNKTGGDGNFAIVDSDYLGIGNSQDTSLVTPVVNLSGQSAPTIDFDTYYDGYDGQVADVDVTTNGGSTWKNVWEHTDDSVSGPQSVAIGAVAANKPAVQIRFHFTSTWGEYWELDDVAVGTRTCDPVRGGLVVGRVVDGNTHAGVVGATVTSVSKPTDTATTVATPDDPALGDGFYHLFSSLTGPHKFTAAKKGYTPTTKTVNVAEDYVVSAQFSLGAGRLTVTPTSITQTVKMGHSATTDLTLQNTGTAPVDVKIGEQPGSFTLLGVHQDAARPAVQRIKAPTPLTAQLPKHSASAHATTYSSTAPADPPWVNLADYPTPILDNKAAADPNGTVYSVGGTQAGDGSTSASYKYDASSQTWSPIADLPTAVQQPGIGFADDKLVVASGIGDAPNPVSDTQVYDPSSDTWSSGAADPSPVWAPGSAVVNGTLYVVAGCTTGDCTPATTDAYAYDTGSDSWTRIADYPKAVAFLACGGVDGKLVCSGGVDPDSSVGSSATYVYDPGQDSWTQGADMPDSLWGAAALGANGQFLVSGGAASDGTITNAGYAYDPSADSWTDLPPSNNAVYRGAGACGFDKIGGSTGNFDGSSVSEQLPGYTDCGGTSDVPWLSEDPTELTVAPGTSATVHVTLDASDLSVVPQPGTYTAQLVLQTDTPYSVAPVGVTMNATPPATWGKVAGTVKGVDCSGKATALPGATVEVDSFAQSFTLKTDANGGYGLWLDVRNNPLTMIVAKDGYKPQTKQVRIARGTTTTVDYSLKVAKTC